MITRDGDPNARREFLKFLAASPYVAALGGVTAFVQQRAFAQETSNVIAGPANALDVFDFQEAARRKVQPAHWALTVSGVDDDATLRANREGFNHVQLRPRCLRDATKLDMRVERATLVWKPMWYSWPPTAPRQVSMSRRLSRSVSWAKAIARYWSQQEKFFA